MSIVVWILDHLNQVPDVIWSGVIASVITLTGVMLSNRSNTFRLQLQLSHDACEKHKDRSAAIRRDVYLEATEEMSRVSSYFGHLPQLNPLKDNPNEGMKGFFSAAAKMQLVSEQETAKLVGELATRYGEVFLTLLAKVQPVHNLKIESDIAKDFYDRNLAEANRALFEMTQINESGRPDPNRYDALHNSYEYAESMMEKFDRDRQDLNTRHAAAHKAYSIAMMREIKSLGQLQVLVAAATRRELNLETDITKYEAQLQDNWERMDKKMSEALAEIEGS
jgi:hypothetical protein